MNVCLREQVSLPANEWRTVTGYWGCPKISSRHQGLSQNLLDLGGHGRPKSPIKNSRQNIPKSYLNQTTTM
jgi:hypothetical protein